MRYLAPPATARWTRSTPPVSAGLDRCLLWMGCAGAAARHPPPLGTAVKTLPEMDLTCPSPPPPPPPPPAPVSGLNIYDVLEPCYHGRNPYKAAAATAGAAGAAAAAAPDGPSASAQAAMLSAAVASHRGWPLVGGARPGAVPGYGALLGPQLAHTPPCLDSRCGAAGPWGRRCHCWTAWPWAAPLQPACPARLPSCPPANHSALVGLLRPAGRCGRSATAPRCGAPSMRGPSTRLAPLTSVSEAPGRPPRGPALACRSCGLAAAVLLRPLQRFGSSTLRPLCGSTTPCTHADHISPAPHSHAPMLPTGTNGQRIHYTHNVASMLPVHEDLIARGARAALPCRALLAQRDVTLSLHGCCPLRTHARPAGAEPLRPLPPCPAGACVQA